MSSLTQEYNILPKPIPYTKPNNAPELSKPVQKPTYRLVDNSNTKPITTEPYTGIFFNVNMSRKNTRVNKFINNLSVDIVCVQENGNNASLTNYTQKAQLGEPTEQVAIYDKLDTKNPFITISTTPIKLNKTTNPESNYLVARNAVIYDYNSVKIANLHLEGGRFADRLLLLDDNFNYMIKYKLQLLYDIVNHKPNIILGDFNSAYCSDINTYHRHLLNQILYFQIIFNKELTEPEIKKVFEWNFYPIALLLQLGYTYATPNNETDLTTSNRGNITVDLLFYDNTVKVNTKIIGLYTDDHNPVSFTFNKTNQEQHLNDLSNLDNIVKLNYDAFYEFYSKQPKQLLQDYNKTSSKAVQYDHDIGYNKMVPYDHDIGYDKMVPYDHDIGYNKMAPYGHDTGYKKMAKPIQNAIIDLSTKEKIISNIKDIHNNNPHLLLLANKHKNETLLFPLNLSQDTNQQLLNLLDNQNVLDNYNKIIADYLNDISYNKFSRDVKTLDKYTNITYYTNNQNIYYLDNSSDIEIIIHSQNIPNKDINYFIGACFLAYAKYGRNPNNTYKTINEMNSLNKNYTVSELDKTYNNTSFNYLDLIKYIRNFQLIILNKIRTLCISIFSDKPNKFKLNRYFTELTNIITNEKKLFEDFIKANNMKLEEENNFYSNFCIYLNRLIDNIKNELEYLISHNWTCDYQPSDITLLKLYLWIEYDVIDFIKIEEFQTCHNTCIDKVNQNNMLFMFINKFLDIYHKYKSIIPENILNELRIQYNKPIYLSIINTNYNNIIYLIRYIDPEIPYITPINYNSEPIISKSMAPEHIHKYNSFCDNLYNYSDISHQTLLGLHDDIIFYKNKCNSKYKASTYIIRPYNIYSFCLLFLWSIITNKFDIENDIRNKRQVILKTGKQLKKFNSDLLSKKNAYGLLLYCTYIGMIQIKISALNRKYYRLLIWLDRSDKYIISDENGVLLRIGIILYSTFVTYDELLLLNYKNELDCKYNEQNKDILYLGKNQDKSKHKCQINFDYEYNGKTYTKEELLQDNSDYLKNKDTSYFVPVVNID